jgi:uncharacterized protein (DUF1501 family)
MDRRSFLQKAGLTTAGTLFVPAFLRAVPAIGENERGFRKLIVIQLSGGNDGLNTIVPFRQDPYFQLRPRLALNENERIQLGEEFAIHQALQPLRKIYDAGEWAIINGVGYPDPNRSHFRSMDIWQSASDAHEFLSTGWLGRHMDGSDAPRESHQILEVDASLSLANRGEDFKALSLTNPQLLHAALHHGWLGDVVQEAKHHDHEHPHNLSYLYQTLVSTSDSAGYLQEKHKAIRPSRDFPLHEFGRRLKLISELIRAGVDTSVYYTSLGGFDTHVNQKGGHARLLEKYAKSVAALVENLKDSGDYENTLIFTFTEFGRRVKQNASNGTDHGTANNVHLMGGSLKKAGMINPVIDLGQLDNNDLIHTVDFRAVYAEILTKWFGSTTQALGNRSYPTFGLFPTV